MSLAAVGLLPRRTSAPASRSRRLAPNSGLAARAEEALKRLRGLSASASKSSPARAVRRGDSQSSGWPRRLAAPT